MSVVTLIAVKNLQFQERTEYIKTFVRKVYFNFISNQNFNIFSQITSDKLILLLKT